MGISVISGHVVSGLKQGAFFTRLDWVRAQCRSHLGFEPHPGTLNVEVSDESRPAAAALLKAHGKELIPPDSAYCSGRVFPATVGGIAAAVVIPATAVRSHSGDVVEVISAANLRQALGLSDGDRVSLFIGGID